MPMADTVRYESLGPAIAQIALARSEKRNALDVEMIYGINDAFDLALGDDAVKVIVVAADGEHFSAGHDFRSRQTPSDYHRVGTWGGYELPGAEGWMAREEELYFHLVRRWRDAPKPTIAAVQGVVIGGALPLVWACDIIVAADDAVFCDPTVAMGVNGVEYFAHPWEFGPRKAKEMLFTGDRIDAREAAALGMVNKVVPRAELGQSTLAMAERIATKPSFALKLAKQSVNDAVDAQGQYTALRSAMGLQQLAHSHNQMVFGSPVDPGAMPKRNPVRSAE
jgi:enoyl-CoA hydratase